MKKTTAYGRKLKRGCAGMKDLGAALDTISICRPYSPEIVPGSWIPDSSTQGAALKAMLYVREAFESIKTGKTKPDFCGDHDYIVHAMGVTILRLKDMGNSDDALMTMYIANSAMQRCADRWKVSKKWGFDGPAILEIGAALDIYEAVLQASSPLQMQNALKARIKLLNGRSQLTEGK